LHGDGRAGSTEDFLFRASFIQEPNRVIRIWAEDLEKVSYDQLVLHKEVSGPGSKISSGHASGIGRIAPTAGSKSLTEGGEMKSV
jgi:hypothetical protein